MEIKRMSKVPFGILLELTRGFELFEVPQPSVTVFGSARASVDNAYCQIARELGREPAECGFTVITGGGGGIMEAAIRGAKEAGGHGIGCNMKLPKEQKPNAYLDYFVEFAAPIVQTLSVCVLAAPAQFRSFRTTFIEPSITKVRF